MNKPANRVVCIREQARSHIQPYVPWVLGQMWERACSRMQAPRSFTLRPAQFHSRPDRNCACVRHCSAPRM